MWIIHPRVVLPRVKIAQGGEGLSADSVGVRPSCGCDNLVALVVTVTITMTRLPLPLVTYVKREPKPVGRARDLDGSQDGPSCN